MNNQFTNENPNGFELANELKNEFGFENRFQNELKNENEEVVEMKIGNETKAGNELEMNSKEIIVEFKATYKLETISGYMYLEEADDEKPLRFYDEGGESWYVPSNPNDSDFQPDWWDDYEHLTQVFNETDIIQYLCDFANDSKTVVIGENNREDKVFLLINGGSDE